MQTGQDYRGSVPSSAAFAAARIISGPLLRTFPTFGLASWTSISSDSYGRSRSRGSPLRLFPVQPAIVVARMENDGHAGVDLGREFVRLGRDDGEGLEPMPTAVFPGVPQTRERKWPAVAQLKGVGLPRRLALFGVE